MSIWFWEAMGPNYVKSMREHFMTQGIVNGGDDVTEQTPSPAPGEAEPTPPTEPAEEPLEPADPETITITEPTLIVPNDQP